MDGPPVHATSRTLARNLTRAKNDVLATCGMLRHTRQRSRSMQDAAAYFRIEKGGVEKVIWENHVGLFFRPVDFFVLVFASWWMDCIRNRYQTFAMFADVPYRDMIQLQRRHFGLYGLLFSGIPAQLALTMLGIGREYLLFRLYDWGSVMLARYEPSRRRRTQKLRWLKGLHHVLDASTFVALAPLEYYTVLQMLNLIPCFPIFPPLHSMIPLSPSSPIQPPLLPTTLTTESVASLVLRVLQSPLTLLWIHEKIQHFVHQRSFALVRALLPKPDSPDPSSVQAALNQDLGVREIPGIEPSEPWAYHPVVAGVRRWMSRQGQRRPWLGLGLNLSLVGPGRPAPRPLSDPLVLGVPPVGDESAVSHERAPVGLDPAAGGALSPSVAGVDPVRRERVGMATPPIEAAESMIGVSERWTTARRIAETAAALEHHAHDADSDADDGIRRRVTTLSSFPATSTATHVSVFLATWLALPFEAFFLRSLASSFLAHARSSDGQLRAASFWLGEVYPPTAHWNMMRAVTSLPSYDPCSTLRYFSNLATCAGLDVAASFALFELGYVGAVWLGRSRCDWGQP
ncbi:MAG: hypothetical protein M1838_003029 [Thelocarpon superellum]|nr:MAG: hypothetical protein M1838_003029 [Thelocarpon superellum]